jgi:hypothetical protein
MKIDNINDALECIDGLSDEFSLTYAQRDLNGEYPREEMDKLK